MKPYPWIIRSMRSATTNTKGAPICLTSRRTSITTRTITLIRIKMQATAASCLISSIVLPTRSSTKSSVPRSSTPLKNSIKISASAVAAPESSSNIDYSSCISVFPMEACDVLGGEACNTKMFPEVRLAAAASTSKPRMASEEIARDYLDYNDPKTVFPGEACDDLGGEFCEAEYQNGVY